MIFLSLTQEASAVPPLTQQGRMVDANGVAVEGANLTYRIYDDLTGAISNGSKA